MQLLKSLVFINLLHTLYSFTESAISPYSLAPLFLRVVLNLTTMSVMVKRLQS